MKKVLSIVGICFLSLVAVGGLALGIISFISYKSLEDDISDIKETVNDLKKKVNSGNTSYSGGNGNGNDYAGGESGNGGSGNENGGGNSSGGMEEPIEVTEYSNIEMVNISKIQQMIKDKKSFILVVTQTYCVHCLNYKPVLNEVLKDNNIKGYEVDLLLLSEDELNDLYKIIELDGTPTTYFFVKGKLKNDYTFAGNLAKETIIENIKKAGFIK